MALEFYVEQADRAPQSGIANETIKPGELIHEDGDGVDVLSYADSVEHVGLARYDAQAFAREHEDEERTAEYDPSDDQRDRVQYQPFEDSAVVRVRTAEDNSTDPAASVSHRDVVGYLDETSTVSNASEFKGRVVEEGYTDDAATTYNRGNNNFKAIGVAYRPARKNGNTISEFDYPVRVVLFDEPKDS